MLWRHYNGALCSIAVLFGLSSPVGCWQSTKPRTDHPAVPLHATRRIMSVFSIADSTITRNDCKTAIREYDLSWSKFYSVADRATRQREGEGGRETWNLCGRIWWPSFLWLIFLGPGGRPWPLTPLIFMQFLVKKIGKIISEDPSPPFGVGAPPSGKPRYWSEGYIL